jgi:hypothetical protein
MTENQVGLISNMGNWISDANNISSRSEQRKHAHDSTGGNNSGIGDSSVVHLGPGAPLFMPYEIVHDYKHQKSLSYADAVKLRHG